MSNKNVLITGGSSGIGQAIAVAFSRSEANVTFTYNSNRDGAQKTLDLMRPNSNKKYAIQANLSEVNNIERVFDKALTYMKTIDILVNNAGVVNRFSNLLDITLEALDEVTCINLKAPFLLTQLAAKHMIQNKIKGSIINISSLSAMVTSPGLGHYECSKSAMEALTRAAANDLAEYHIRVNSIAPGLVETNINKTQRENQPEIWKSRSSKIPLKRVGTPEDIANMALFLGSEQAEWITGASIIIDGGLNVRSPFG